MPELTGFDSEADRRDAIRKQLIDECVAGVREAIRKEGVTRTFEERLWLETTVARNLLQGVQQDLMSKVYRQEITEAAWKIED